jgi:hypothetical protein
VDPLVDGVGQQAYIGIGHGGGRSS